MTEEQVETKGAQAAPLAAFNARTMSARQVATTFIPPDAFETLIQPNNTLLSGPRGSGKTTLLKMLQPAALEFWTHADAVSVRSAVRYTGVFIATDRTWKQQLLPGGKSTPEDQALELVADSAFTTHVLREVSQAMAFRAHSLAPAIESPHTRVELAPKSERQLVGMFARMLSLPVDAPSLEGVVDALTLRLAHLGNFRVAIRDGQPMETPAWMRLECLTVAESMIDLFNRATNDHDHQWALLFDEMELAPPRIVTTLLDAMRGQSQTLLLKLSLSPVQPEFARLHLPQSGTHGQDFELVRLTYADQREGQAFARKLVSAEIERRYSGGASIEQLLGPSLFTSRDDGDFSGRGRSSGPGRRNPYATGSVLWKRYKALAASDPSFATWLENKDVDLEHLEKLSPNERASKLRKVRNLVVVREFYRRSDQRRRSRKTYELYTGSDALLTFVDGNPRLLKALIGQLLPATSSVPARLIPVSEQSRAIESIIGRFLALLRSLPGIGPEDSPAIGVMELLNAIGRRLSYDVIEAPFRDNVATSFRVDRAVSPIVVRGLQLALNAGAIVHLPREAGRPVPPDLSGESFRLSYVLAPYYGLPLRLGPVTPLSPLLNRRRPRPLEATSSKEGSAGSGELDPFQASLFDV